MTATTRPSPADALRTALGEVIAAERRVWRREREAMETEMRDAVAAHRERIGRFPRVKPWADRVHRESELVTHSGSLWQAARDTAKAPPHEDWTCVAAGGRPGDPGRTMAACGTWEENGIYRALDVVALNGASFVALHDNPGRCPGEGWQLLASAGKRGRPGASVTGAAISDDGLLTLQNADGTRVEVDLYPLLSRIAHAKATA